MSETSSEYIDRISKEYGIYTLDNRGIPSMFDGLKTSQRIALWIIRNRAEKIKTAALGGAMIASELYVHGDTSANDTVSLLAAKFRNNHPLLDGIGGFGSKPEPNPTVAARYTYVKRNKFAQTNLYVDMEILPMVENHDGSNTMPGTFLPLIPLVLLNGVRGMATGWSTNILPHKYEDLKRAVLEVIETGKVQKELVPHFEGYDIDVVDGFQGKYKLSGRAKIKNTSTVIITELPPDVPLEDYREILDGLEAEGKISGYTDRSKKTVNIEVKFQRVALAVLKGDSLIEYLKLRTPGRASAERIVVLGENGVRQYETPEELVEDWVRWRLSWYPKRFEYLRDKALDDELFWRSYIACHDGSITFSGVPTALHDIKTRAALKTYIRDLIQLNDITYNEDIGERLATLPLYRWTQEEYERAKVEVEEAAKRAAKFERLRKSPAKHKVEFKKDLLALKA